METVNLPSTAPMLNNYGLSPVASKPAVTSNPVTPPVTAPITKPSTTTSQYPVVTSKPATNAVNGIQSTYTSTIQPAIAAKTSNNTTVKSNNSNLPVMAGYNVTSTSTGNQGEIKGTNPVTGETFYANPQTVSGSSSTTDTSQTQTSPQTPSQTATANTGINPTTESANYSAALNAGTDALTSAANNYTSVINGLSAGSIPFTPAQQSLIDATNGAFSQMISQANLKAAALSSETGGVSDKINATGGELIKIASDQAAAVASMEVGFQKENFTEKYQAVTDGYQAYKDAETAKMDALTKIHADVMQTYHDAVSAAAAQQTFNQTVFQDAASIKNSRYDFEPVENAFGQRIGTKVFDKQTGTVVSNTYDSGQTDPATGLTTPIVTTNPTTGAVDPTSQAQFLATLPKAYQSLVQGIANGNIEPPSARTAQGAQILSWVASYDPTLSDGSGGFDATKFAARKSLATSLASDSPTSMGGALKTANTVIAHLNSFLTSANAIPGKFPVNPFNVNGITSNIAAGTEALFGNTSGQQAKTNANIIGTGLTDEMTKFFKGTGGTDVASIATWGASLNPNAAGGSVQGAVQGGLTLFSGQMNSFIGQYTSVMGHAPDMSTILNPQTVQTLSNFKNQGYKIDIPGIYFTDKDAYLKNGGSQDSLNNAYNTLKSNGIPTTPENVLQAAQI